MGLLSPIYLLFALSIGVLILIYLSARSRSTVEVSSLLLFDESQIDVTKARFLKLDLLFWLETAALAALCLALAGLYLKMAPAATGHRRRALVFDLAAAMGARDGGHTRLDEARAQALRMVNSAAPGESFAVVSYAEQAQVERYFTSDRPAVRAAIKALRPYDVASAPAAINAALMRVRDADEIDLFAPRLHFHQIGTDENNAAITALDSGTPRVSPGHCTVRNMSSSAVLVDLGITLNGRAFDRAMMILPPHAQNNVKFGPLPSGGLVEALIGTPDGLMADNSRYAYASAGRSLKGLIISPDPAVRDDLARVLRAVDPGSIVAAGRADDLTPSIIAKSLGGAVPDIAIIHDSAPTPIAAAATLWIYPPARGPFPVRANLRVSQMDDRTDLGPLTRPLLLGPTRVLSLPEWMNPIAHGTGLQQPGLLTLAAFGVNGQGPQAVIAFDIRNHLLMDPDMLDALVLTVDLVKQLNRPSDLQIVPTGSYVTLPASGPARIREPDGSTIVVPPGDGGVLRFRPLYAGRYDIMVGGHRKLVYANYFDAAESELSVKPAPQNGPPISSALDLDSGVRAARVQPLTLALAALAMMAFLLESALLVRRALRGGVSLV